MKKVIALLLCVVTLLSLCACGGGSGAAASGGDYKFPDIKLGDFNYPEVKDKLTWDKINAFPIKSSDMTVEEMRQLCVDFFRFSKTVVWTPNANLHYVKNNNGSEDDIFKGNVYGGFPYIGGGGCGNVYRAMDYYDTETGFYYLQSRYYDPGSGRYLNLDVVFNYDTGFPGYNLFAYCGNSPVFRIDVSGNDSDRLEDNKSKLTQADNLDGGGDGVPPAPVGGSTSGIPGIIGQPTRNKDTVDYTKIKSAGNVGLDDPIYRYG